MNETREGSAAGSEGLLFLTDEQLRKGIEAMFFAYRGFTSDPDRILENYAYGRAHHRAIHFIHRSPGTTVNNLLAILETMRGLTRRDRLNKSRELVEQFGLTAQRKQLARTLSGGERRKLEIARALVTEPKLIMLDEPFSGVDPKAVESLQEEILRLKRERGIAILLTDHNVRETLRVTDRSYIIHDGEMLAEGKPRDVVRNPLVRKTYLGSSLRSDEFDGPQ